MYDVAPPANSLASNPDDKGMSSLVVKLNNFGRDLGLGGVFHGAVQIGEAVAGWHRCWLACIWQNKHMDHMLDPKINIWDPFAHRQLGMVLWLL